MSLIITICSILIAEAAGILGSVFTYSGVKSWYPTLMKPTWNPPSWIFGPVWTTLYALMGIAASLVWNLRDRPGAKLALWVYGTQLALNAIWSILFFGLKNPGLAFAEIIPLLALIILTTVLFWRINAWAGILLLPYVAWVSFATYLNYTLWQLN
ncbi:MAG: tryptophan-rich sensory protein [Candidatus Peribacteraceae bacterium]|nr:tryptophan-rich sensory protein [Candidatus Peribacteraceae bacterium]